MPHGADGFPFGGGVLLALGEFFPEIDVEFHHDKFIGEQILHARIGPDVGFHLAAVHTRFPRKIQQDRAVHRLGKGRGLFQVGEHRNSLRAGFPVGKSYRFTPHGHRLYLEDFERLLASARRSRLGIGRRRGKGRDDLHRSAPDARHQVQGEGQGDQRQEQARYRDAFQRAIVRQADFSQQVKAHHRKDHHPESDEHLAFQQVPVQHHIRIGEKFEGEGQFDKAQHHFDRVEPTAGFGQPRKPTREQGKECKRQGQSDGKPRHAHHRAPEVAFDGGFHQDRPYEGTCARKRHQSQGKGHEEDPYQPGPVGLAVHLVHPRGRKGQFERSEERSREDHQQHEEENVEPRVGRHRIERVCPEEGRNPYPQDQVNRYDGQSVKHRIADALLPVGIPFHEEADRHWDHRKDTRGNQRQQPCDKGKEERPEQSRGSPLRSAVCLLGGIECSSFLDLRPRILPERIRHPDLRRAVLSADHCLCR